jgi:hypothetical protein
VADLDTILAPARAASPTLVGPATSPREVAGHVRREPDAATCIARSGRPADPYILARILESEAGSQPLTYRYCIGEAVLNDMAATGDTLLQLATGGINPNHFGAQSGRHCATSQDPRLPSYLVAEAVLARRGSPLGLAKGARRWFSPRTQDGGTQGGKPLKFDAVALVKKRAGEGWEWVGDIFHPNTGEWLIDPYLLCLFKWVGKGKAIPTRGLAMVELGRKSPRGKSGPLDEGTRDEPNGGKRWAAGALLAGLLKWRG